MPRARLGGSIPLELALMTTLIWFNKRIKVADFSLLDFYSSLLLLLYLTLSHFS